ncbi:microviridin/marinostatin family tricyclic proteinase inhibitor [Sinomicrobium sp. M5D2P9]
MKKENKSLKKPFFANFLEHQVSGEEQESVQGGATLKFPSDQEEDGSGTTSTITKPVLDQDGGGDVTQKFPSDDDEEGDIM